MDKSKFGHVKMQDIVDFWQKSKEHEFLVQDVKVLEMAYRVIKMLQLNSQEPLTRQEFDYLFIYLHQHFVFY